MELSKLLGNIIGIVSSDTLEIFDDCLVKDLLQNKCFDALKMVNLDSSYAEAKISSLSLKEKNIISLASQLNNNIIILKDFSNGLIDKDLKFYQKLLKKISSYNKKIILISKDINLFINLVDHIYVLDNDNIIYETTNIFDLKLYNYISKPKIIEFVQMAKDKGIKIDYTTDFNDLLKAIYRSVQ